PPKTEPPPTTVPLPADYFAGRGNFISKVIDLLYRVRLVTLWGAPGIGKTQIACAVAHQALKVGCFPGGAYFVDLQGATSAASLVGRVVAELGLSHIGSAQK